jgi:photosystem II stability/assembly factor-like uncharacterized protein
VTRPARADSYRVSFEILDVTDGGVTWHPADASLPGVALAISADPNPGTLIAATDDGLYRSTNNGATWQHQLAAFFSAINPRDREFLTRDVSNPSNVWAGGNPTERSGDGGVTWSYVGGPNAAADLSPVPGDPNTVYTVDSSGQLYRSTRVGGSLSWNFDALQIVNGFPLFLTNVRVGLDGAISPVAQLSQFSKTMPKAPCSTGLVSGRERVEQASPRPHRWA